MQSQMSRGSDPLRILGYIAVTLFIIIAVWFIVGMTRSMWADRIAQQDMRQNLQQMRQGFQTLPPVAVQTPPTLISKVAPDSQLVGIFQRRDNNCQKTETLELKENGTFSRTGGCYKPSFGYWEKRANIVILKWTDDFAGSVAWELKTDEKKDTLILTSQSWTKWERVKAPLK